MVSCRVGSITMPRKAAEAPSPTTIRSRANRAAAKAGLVHLRIWVTKEQAEAIMAIIEADE